ncbi:MAG: DUF3817 domain-containing protein [Opitutales bacterium]
MSTRLTGARALHWLRVTALSEGVSYLLLLFLAMPLKYGAGWDLGVRVVGMVHGLLFIALCGVLIWAKRTSPLTWPLGWLVFFASLVPFGAFWADCRLKAFAAAQANAQGGAPASPMQEALSKA